MNAKELLNALDAFEQEKGIEKEVVIEALKEALVKAYKKINDPDALCRVEVDAFKGTIEMYEQKNVVEEVQDDLFEIELEEARKVDPNLNIGDVLETPVDPDTLTRLAALQAKQVLTQKIREYEKQSVYDAYIDKKGDIIVGVVDRIEPNFILINIGKTNAIMKTNNILPGEKFKVGQTIRAYVVDVDKASSGAAVVVSRTDPGFLKRLFESEISEIYDGTVEIKDVAREAGDRAKVSVFSRNMDVDATGSCIGQKGVKIQSISNQILGEKIDVINYYKDPVLYIAEALKPANVLGVKLLDEKNAIAVVNDEDYSLAIGKKGINARLAVKLTGIKIDIKNLSDAVSDGVEYTSIDQARADYEYSLKEEIKPTVHNDVTLETSEDKEVEEVVEPIKVIEQEPVKVEIINEVKVEVSKPKKETKKEEKQTKAKKEEKETKRTTISKEELQDIKRKNEEARSYMPVYTDEELESLDDEEEEVDDYYDRVDYDEYDSYYDED